ncbi:tyrosine-type recombinase/integrase [Chroococcidiopsis sp. CCMEE 29]|uniref:tyrosine-type recombinase/integrase n=1 Tax=Chroococcidiopsis sp. CCMEE 29 TaxID=155894 RepID=UPI002021BC50|nr:tyrosine-type recombinase/integrase [Chroococcidiopsis sp. CCMEE 29]
MSSSPPPVKVPFSVRRDHEFLYLQEVDALITALAQTRYPIRNQALALLLFCQALQPSELCWLRWCDLNFSENLLLVTRNRLKSSRCPSGQITVNLQPLCPPEIDILQKLYTQRTTGWVFASERKQRLNERSLHHLIQQAGANAGLPLTVHPYMLRRSGLYYRAAVLLQPLGLSLRSCCLLWNWYNTNIPFSAQQEQEYGAIRRKQEEAFLIALERMKAFTGIGVEQNVIDYLLGAFLLFPRLQGIPQDYWLTPTSWHEQTLPKKFRPSFSR